jgi:transposase, IS4 family
LTWLELTSSTLHYRAVTEAHLANIVKVNLAADVFTYEIDQRALSRARMMDGKLILVSNMPDHTPAEIVARCKALADIERGFRVLKSEIEIAPAYHRLPNRIRARALICFLALVLYRLLRMRLKARDSQLSPERALEIARRIQFHPITLHQSQSASGLSAMTPQQKALFETVTLPEPSAKRL